MDVGPETFKLLNKMWKPNKGYNSQSYGPLAPILYYHTSLSSGTKSDIGFMDVGPETI